MTDIKAITKRYKELHKELQKQIKEARKKIKVEAQSIIKGVFDEFFEKHPNVYAIGWTQYTPYWQDGEECTFRVNEIKLFLSKDSQEEDEDDYHEGDQELLRDRAYYAKDGDQEELAKIDAKIAQAGGIDAYKAIVKDFGVVTKILEAIENEYMEMLYGDHVSVLYTKKGVKVEEYDHE
jgi:hypothetical protein